MVFKTIFTFSDPLPIFKKKKDISAVVMFREFSTEVLENYNFYLSLNIQWSVITWW